MLDAGTGRSGQLRSRSSLRPWNRPESTMMRVPLDSTRYFEPVTVRAAPRNVKLINLPPATCYLPTASCYLPTANCQRLTANRSLCKQSDLPAGVPEQHRASGEFLAADPGDQAGHGFRGVGGIEEQRLPARAQFDRLGGLRRRHTVAAAHERVVDLERRAAERTRLEIDQPFEVAENAADLHGNRRRRIVRADPDDTRRGAMQRTAGNDAGLRPAR